MSTGLAVILTVLVYLIVVFAFMRFFRLIHTWDASIHMMVKHKAKVILGRKKSKRIFHLTRVKPVT